MPKIGDVMSLFPGHKAVFRGEYAFDCPVYETVIEPHEFDETPFLTLMKKLDTTQAGD